MLPWKPCNQQLVADFFDINSLTQAKVLKDLVVNLRLLKLNSKESIREFIKSVLKCGLEIIEAHRKRRGERRKVLSQTDKGFYAATFMRECTQKLKKTNKGGNEIQMKL